MNQAADHPLISVVIVNYNGGAYLLDTVHAALASTVSIEVFVVDNGSVDDSIQALEQACAGEHRLRIIENGANLGFAKANNVALEQARGDYMLLLNPDCLVKPETLAQMLDAMRADPGAGMAGCLICNPDGSEQTGCRRSIPTPWSGLVRVLHLGRLMGERLPQRQMDLTHKPLPDRPVYVEAISGAFMMVRRKALEQTGLMDEDYFLHCEDLDWCQVFQDTGWRILFVPSVEIIHHKGVCSVGRPVSVLWHKHRGMVRFYRKFLSQRYPMPLNWLVLMGIWIRFSLLLPVVSIRRLFSERHGSSLSIASRPQIDQPPPLPYFEGLSDRTVLVTGGTGFIGRRLVTELLRQGARVRVLSRSAPEPAVPWASSEVEWLRGDMQDAASLERACKGIHTLFHLAGCAHQLDSFDAGDTSHRDITEKGTLHLLLCATRAGLSNFIFVSSVKAMGEGSEDCLDEDTPATPESPYGIAKLHAEQAVLATAKDGSMQAAVLRLPLVYGPGNKGNLPRMMNAISEGRFPPLPKVNNRRSMVHVDDAVQAMILCATLPQANGQTYIITDGQEYSTWDIYQAIASNLGHRPPRWTVPLGLIRLGARLGDGLLKLHLPVSLNGKTVRKLLGSAWYRDGKIRNDLGYKPRYDLQQALPQMVLEADGVDISGADPAPNLCGDPLDTGMARRV